MTSRLPSAYLGIFFVAGSIILFEIAMTRVFAIMMWHHFTYLVISIALLGFGAAGSILTATRATLRTTPPSRELGAWSTAYAVALIAAFFVCTRIRIDSLEIWHDKTNFLTLFLIYAVLSVPLLLGGLAVGLALARLSDRVNKLYCADLLGSAAGAAASVWILERFGNTTAIMSAGAVGLLGALLFSFGAPVRSRILPAALLAASIFLVLGFAGGRLEWVIPYAPGKDLHGLKTDVRLPSATAEVEVTEPYRHPPGIGGDFGGPDAGPVDLRVVLQDGTAPTALFKNAADIDSHPYLDDTQAASAYVCRRAVRGANPNVLVIGVGGGIDIMIALAHGASHVTGVEINRAMIDMSTKVFPGYTGGWLVPGAYRDSGRVDLVHSEGRSYVRRRDDRYDIIQMSGVDTFTALSTGAYTLSESYLYTVEAVKEFYEHLNDGGYVCYSRLILSYPRPRETLRLANIAVTALEELSVPDAASHVCVFQGVTWASTMIKRGPFTAAEIQALERFAFDLGFFGLVFDPLAPPAAPYPPSPRTFSARLPELRAFVRKEIVPPDTTVSDSEADALAARVWGLVSARIVGDEAAFDREKKKLLESFPLQWRDRAETAISASLDDAARLAKADNEHFHAVRRDFESLLRNDRTGRERFADDYPYDVSPCRDDRPFYFNYYKYSGLFRSGTEAGQLWANPDFPIGHMVLVASLVQILLLAVVLIILPIRRLARHGMQTEGKLSYLGYFSALGLGFMSIEIVMMQKMVLFLGHPTHALSVVLTALLASTGLGSLLSERLPVRRRSFVFVLGAIVVTSIGALLVANHAFPLLLGRPLPERIGWVILVLTPLGTALGMAFPTGIRLVRERAPALIPWCWAINGITSVFATIFSIMVALEVGFSVVVILAAAIYFAGTMAILRIASPAPAPGPPASAVSI